MSRQPQGRHVRANGVRLHYLRYGGAGPALVLVPGIASPAMLWDHVGRWLGKRHDCFILDVRGRGLSESGPLLDYGVDACAADVLAFGRALGLQRPIVVGHSMGARIALRANRLDAGAFGPMVLLDPPTSGPGRRHYPIPMKRTLDLVRAAHRGEAEAALRQPDQAPWPEDLLLLRAEWLATVDERAIQVTYDDFRGQDMFADLAQARGPVSLICAGKGGVVSDEDVRDMLALNPRLRTLRLPTAGHQMQVDDFPAFCEALAGVLGDAAPPSRQESP